MTSAFAPVTVLLAPLLFFALCHNHVTSTSIDIEYLPISIHPIVSPSSSRQSLHLTATDLNQTTTAQSNQQQQRTQNLSKSNNTTIDQSLTQNRNETNRTATITNNVKDNKHPMPMSASQMIAEARAEHKKFMKGGYLEFFEWLFVFILVAPGTFPAMGCVLLTCASFWRRRFANATSSNTNTNPQLESIVNTQLESIIIDNSINTPRSPWTPSSYPRTPTGEHGSFVVRSRLKTALDDRDIDGS